MACLGAFACSQPQTVTPPASSGGKKCDKAELRLTQSKVTYDDNIKDIVAANCLEGCHTEDKQSPDLTTYDNIIKARVAVVEAVENGSMPKLEEMADADIEAFTEWKDGGYLEDPDGKPLSDEDEEDDEEPADDDEADDEAEDEEDDACAED
jgi:hypothetical protein